MSEDNPQREPIPADLSPEAAARIAANSEALQQVAAAAIEAKRQDDEAKAPEQANNENPEQPAPEPDEQTPTAAPTPESTPESPESTDTGETESTLIPGEAAAKAEAGFQDQQAGPVNVPTANHVEAPPIAEHTQTQVPWKAEQED
jgi:hypothetical protein